MHNFLFRIMKCRICFLQGLWANNGDALSRQYAGTNALKGDFTRTGERNLSGLMKDGMNSASRYYLNQFRDAYRQATIDLMTGQIVSESLVAGHFDEGKPYFRDIYFYKKLKLFLNKFQIQSIFSKEVSNLLSKDCTCFCKDNDLLRLFFALSGNVIKYGVS